MPRKRKGEGELTTRATTAATDAPAYFRSDYVQVDPKRLNPLAVLAAYHSLFGPGKPDPADLRAIERMLVAFLKEMQSAKDS